jgi:N6-adenosine-specific RNA methylase IME4
LQRRPSGLPVTETKRTADHTRNFVHRLHIDPELHNLIPPLTRQEFKSLERNLRREGCRDPVVVWKGRDVIVDGEHRNRICEKYGIPFEVVEKDFQNKSAAKIWMVDNQLARRNLTLFARCVLAIQRTNFVLQKKARERQREGGRSKVSQNSEKAIDVNREAAKRAGVSHDTIAKVRIILEKASEKEKAQLNTPGSRLTIHKVYRRIRRMELRTNTPPFPRRKFAVLYADPPYQFEHTESECRAVENYYHTLSLENLKSLPVGEITKKDCVIFLWAPACKLLEAASLLSAWGFLYRTHAVWLKDHIGMGYYFRAQHEVLLLAVKGNPPVPAEKNRPPSVIYAPRRSHSEKPEKVYDLIEKMYPQFEKIELFARPKKRRAGWTFWGNEVRPPRRRPFKKLQEKLAQKEQARGGNMQKLTVRPLTGSQIRLGAAGTRKRTTCRRNSYA